MIPTSNVEIWQDAVPSGLSVPTCEELREGYIDGNREFNPELMDASWDDAEEALEVERELFLNASLASTAADFDAAMDGDLEDWQMIALDGLDAGVASVALAINAAGCVSTTSCRGHHDRVGSGNGFPRVRFYASAERADAVRDIATRARCGFAGDDDSILEVWSRSVAEMLDLAEALIGARGRFGMLPPRWPAR